ncbi:hypothetical protein SmJEL517_g02510 [Synchytrium microbalum]|uniref:CobW/HypB/UreG nucleotide-binding domain-containing protein n=1 Tax=Synchytrium microbalum TaxID=1806994 RepID=A0A507CAI9_9FUNG|nr:uncharacterized protein SmJEL517_g02510 [Synchytrium microbalum]TPX35004.1 hypothetical protein SmJEL517_g02510 [Synchytrium microbalum]
MSSNDKPAASGDASATPTARFERGAAQPTLPPGFHTHDGVHFHSGHGANAQMYVLQSDSEGEEDEEYEDDDDYEDVDEDGEAPFQHSHDGVHFHSSHAPPSMSFGAGRVPFNMMGGFAPPMSHGHSHEDRNSHGHSHGGPPAPNVDFAIHQPSYGQRGAPQSNLHSHDGVSFHASHGAPSHEAGHHQEAGNHGHTHEQMDHPGLYNDRDAVVSRDWEERAFTIGIGGPVGSGKTALMLALCKRLHPEYNIAAVTNDIFTQEDAEFLIKNDALPQGRIRAVETGGCPHAAIREDISANLGALEELQAQYHTQLLLIESGGDNLAANYSLIDVSGGDKVPRKGGPGITQSDLLVINKTDLAEAVGADLSVMDRDAKKMRDEGPTIFAQVKHGKGVDEIVEKILESYRNSGAADIKLTPL